MATETVDKAPLHKEVEEFSDAERAEWLKSGKVPVLEQEEEIPPKEDASAASTPVKKDGSGPSKKDKPDQTRNWRALEAERNSEREKREAAERELEEYRSGKKKPEEKRDQPKLLEAPVRPKMKQFMDATGVLDSEKYEEALDKYETDKTAYTNQQVQLRTASAQQEQFLKTWNTELKAKYGEKSNGLDVKKTVDTLVELQFSAPAFFYHLQDTDEAIFSDLLFVLGTDPKLNELLEEAKNPKTIIRAIEKLVLLKNGVKAELAKKTSNGSRGSEDDETPPKKDNLSKAGKPPIEASGAKSSPSDDGSAEAALRRKDLSPDERGELYRERRNAEERAKRKKKVN